jgi:hypothetical protein
MEISMDIEQEIKKCFGCDDKKLGVHPTDEKNLKALIKAAKSENKSYTELEKEVVYFLWKQDIHESIFKEHIQQQVDKLRQLF